MSKKAIYELLELKACGMEEICIGLRHGNFDLTPRDIVYIKDSCEEMLEAVDKLIVLHKELR